MHGPIGRCVIKESECTFSLSNCHVEGHLMKERVHSPRSTFLPLRINYIGRVSLAKEANKKS